MHVLSPDLFHILAQHQALNPADLPLTPALQELATADKDLALEVKGNRYDLSKRLRLLQAQVALGLAGQAHDETLTTLVDLLAEANMAKLN